MIMYLEYGHIEHDAFRNDLGCLAMLMAVLKYDRLICVAKLRLVTVLPLARYDNLRHFWSWDT